MVSAFCAKIQKGWIFEKKMTKMTMTILTIF